MQTKISISGEEGVRKLKAYEVAFELAQKVFHISKSFPKQEQYALTDQIRRSSRSICANLAEAFRKRRYPKHFVLKLTDADAECSETKVWIDFAFNCDYINRKTYVDLNTRYNELGKMIGGMIKNAHKFKDPLG